VLNLITIPNGKKVTKSNQKSILEMMPKSSEKDVEHNCSVLKNLFQCAYIDKNSQFGENGNSQKYQESPG
jgi:hypothetical protein